MNLVDMKRPKKSKEETAKMPEMAGESDRYPYGLRLTLEKEELEKLGLNPNEVSVGTACTIQAEGKIEEIAMRETTGKDMGRRSISIQIVKMVVSGGKKGKFQEYSEKKKAGPGV